MLSPTTGRSLLQIFEKCSNVMFMAVCPLFFILCCASLFGGVVVKHASTFEWASAACHALEASAVRLSMCRAHVGCLRTRFVVAASAVISCVTQLRHMPFLSPETLDVCLKW